MARKDPVADAIARLAALRSVEDRQQLLDGLTAALGERSGYVVARAATLAAARELRDAVPPIVTRLTRLLGDPKADDPGCEASLAMARALVTLRAGHEAEGVAIRLTRHVRWEAVRGGSVDVAVAVRGNAAILLAAMGSTLAMRCATELLAEADQPPPRERSCWPARADAAKALTMIGSDGAAAVLRFKLLIGDDETAVISDCLAGLLAIERDAVLPLVERMLAGEDDAQAEAALLALGGWRDTRAFSILHAHCDRFLSSRSRDLFLASVAMTRQPAAIDYLLDLVRTAAPKLRAAATTALEPLRMLPGVTDRLTAAGKA
jgi:hypothetical protein